MMQIILVGIAAGLASAFVFASIASGSALSIPLFYLAPLPACATVDYLIGRGLAGSTDMRLRRMLVCASVAMNSSQVSSSGQKSPNRSSKRTASGVPCSAARASCSWTAIRAICAP